MDIIFVQKRPKLVDNSNSIILSTIPRKGQSLLEKLDFSCLS